MDLGAGLTCWPLRCSSDCLLIVWSSAGGPWLQDGRLHPPPAAVPLWDAGQIVCFLPALTAALHVYWSSDPLQEQKDQEETAAGRERLRTNDLLSPPASHQAPPTSHQAPPTSHQAPPTSVSDLLSPAVCSASGSSAGRQRDVQQLPEESSAGG